VINHPVHYARVTGEHTSSLIQNLRIVFTFKVYCKKRLKDSKYIVQYIFGYKAKKGHGDRLYRF